MILNDAEYEKRWKKCKRDKSLQLPTEQYDVKFRYQKPDGFWTTTTVMYHGLTKADHDKVTKKWREEYPNADLINVTYL